MARWARRGMCAKGVGNKMDEVTAWREGPLDMSERGYAEVRGAMEPMETGRRLGEWHGNGQCMGRNADGVYGRMEIGRERGVEIGRQELRVRACGRGCKGRWKVGRKVSEPGCADICAHFSVGKWWEGNGRRARRA